MVVGEVALTELMEAELIEQVAASSSEYAFHHPLIRAVAYESQLKSGRSQLHKTIAAAIEDREPAAVDKNAASRATEWAEPSSRRAATGAAAPLICTIAGAPSRAACSTSRAVDSLSITPPAGDADSIRWAIPTC
jgi:hypothetical protein